VKGKQGKYIQVFCGYFTRWPVKGVVAVMARGLGNSTVAHDALKVRFSEGVGATYNGLLSALLLELELTLL
jgi:hypothetical protein